VEGRKEKPKIRIFAARGRKSFIWNLFRISAAEGRKQKPNFQISAASGHQKLDKY
jgi:hypothetical protein